MGFKPRRLTVELDHHDSVYYGGQKLQGVVQVELDEPLRITGNVNYICKCTPMYRVKLLIEHFTICMIPECI